MSCPRDGCCSLYASFSCTSLITVRPPPFQRISRDASTDRARTQQSAPTPDRTVRLPRAILRPSPASSRSSPPPDPPAASPASRDPHDVSARPPAGAGIAGVNCPSPGTLTSTLTPDRADAHHQGYPHHGCPPGKQPHHRPAQGPHPGAARARARAQRSPTRRGHPATAREGAPPIPPQAPGDDRPGAQVGVPKAKRAPHPRPKHPTTRHRTRARRPGGQRRANRVGGVPRAAPAGPLRRRQRRRRPRVAHLAPPRWRRHRRARKEEEDRGTTRGGAHPFDG